MMLNCRKIKELLYLYLDGMLSTEENTAIKVHLDNCAQCHQEYLELMDMSQLLQSMGRDIYMAPPDFTAKVMSNLRETVGNVDTNSMVKPADKLKPDILSKYNWKKFSAGIAAAALLAFSATQINLMPLSQVAENPPAINQTTVANGDNLPGPVEDKLPGDVTAPNNSTDNPDINTDSITDTKPSALFAPERQTVPETSTAEKQPLMMAANTNDNGDLDPVLFNKQHQIDNYLIKLQVADINKALSSLNQLNNNYKVQMQNLGEHRYDDQLYKVIKISIDEQISPKYINSLSSLGTILSQDKETKDLSPRYAETLEQYLTLQKQRNAQLKNEGNQESIQQLVTQMAALQKQLETWQNQAAYDTIVLWLQS